MQVNFALKSEGWRCLDFGIKGHSQMQFLLLFLLLSLFNNILIGVTEMQFAEYNEIPQEKFKRGKLVNNTFYQPIRKVNCN